MGNPELLKILVVVGFIIIIVLSLSCFFVVIKPRKDSKPQRIPNVTYYLAMTVMILMVIISILGIVAVL